MAMLNNQRVYIDDIDVNGHHFTSMAMNPMISISTSFHEKLHRCEIGEHSDVNVNNNMAYIYIYKVIYIYIYEIADDRALSTNPRGASDPNVTWKEPGMKFTLVPLSNLIESVLHFPGTDIESQILPSPCFVCVCARMVSKASQPACFLFLSETKFSSKTIFHRNPEARYNMS